MKTKKSILNFILLSLGVLVLINVLSDRYFFRLDFTADKRYTLNKATTDILSSLTQPVTVKAYFSENLPPDVAKTRRDFKELLVEYANRSNGKIVYQFINPNEKEEIEQQAAQAGIQPVMINVREKDQVKQQKAYLGAELQMGDRTEVIPFMQPGAAMEFALSSSIKKLSVQNKPVIGLLQGHGEPNLQALQQAYSALAVLYEVQTVTLNDSTPLSDQIKTLAIIDPKDTFPQSDLQHIEQFMAKGKNVFIAYSHENADLSKATGTARHTGLEDWLALKKINIEDQIIVDALCGNVNVMQQQGGFSFNTQMQFPYFPLINKFEDHPVTKGLEQVVLRFPSPIKYTGDSSLKFIPILKSSDKSGTQQSNSFFNVQKQWTNADFPLHHLTIGAAVSGNIAGGAASKMVVIANGDFAVNGEGQQAAQQLPPDNVNLLVNAIDWLSDDTGLIELRTKGVTSRPLDQTEEGTKTFYKYFNFLLPILLIIAYGFIRMQLKRSQRVRRMEEDFFN
ncbi:MAG: Gldg family protein [Bacteroidetes bacterium]|nr:Gldg family protein [Bacteroidota bacterium]